MTEQQAGGGTWAFLCGADMNPERILEQPAIAQSRFESIGAAPGTVAARAGLPDELAGDQVWGVVLSGCDVSGRTVEPVVEVQLRHGASQRCVVLTTPATVGTIVEVLAEARYWELPLAWRERVAASIEGQIADPKRDGTTSRSSS